MVLMSQAVPGNLLDFISRGHTIETVILVGDANIPRVILGNSMHGSAGNAAYGDKTVILQVADAAKRRDPDSPAMILKKRTGVESVEFADWFGAATARNRNLSIVPSVQATTSRQPNASIPVCQNRLYRVIRQPLAHSKPGDSKVAKAVQAIIGSYPNIPFTILK